MPFIHFITIDDIMLIIINSSPDFLDFIFKSVFIKFPLFLFFKNF